MEEKLAATFIVSSYQRLSHLERCLVSLSRQQGVAANSFEVIVADDGSTDGTQEMVRRLSMRSPYRLRLVTQEKNGFRKARVGNKALSLVDGEYLVLTDGDCFFPSDYLAAQLKDREVGTAWASECIRLDEQQSARVTPSLIMSGEYRHFIPQRLTSTLAQRYRRDRVYQLIRDSRRPKLVGYNMAMWAKDLVSINGFDERFQGWGGEDDDLAIRLRMSGVRIKTNLNRTFGYHLWHPVDPTAPLVWRNGMNVGYLTRPIILARCLQGLVPAEFEDLNILVSSDQRYRDYASALSDLVYCGTQDEADIEIRLGNSPVSARWGDVKRVQVAFPGEKVRGRLKRADFQIDLENGLRTESGPVLRMINRDGESVEVQNSVAESHQGDSDVEIESRWIVKQLRHALMGESVHQLSTTRLQSEARAA
ncbi:glycosyltransferase [bacterium]|nr:glycosyltransferase [bacterium]